TGRTSYRPPSHERATDMPRAFAIRPSRAYMPRRPELSEERAPHMATTQFVYHMHDLTKVYPGGRKCFENMRLNFLPGVKIGVVGVNGSGKSSLLRIMAGQDKDFQGEAWAAEGVRVGFLPQEPE